MLKLGLQLYTLREELEQDFEGTLRKVAELGYSGVEFFNYFGRSAEEVKALLEETGLVALGAHRPYDAMLNDTEEEIRYNLAIGNRNLIIPYLTEEQRNWPEVAANLRIIGEKCRERGQYCPITIMTLNSRSPMESAPLLTGFLRKCRRICFRWKWIPAGYTSPALIR